MCRVRRPASTIPVRDGVIHSNSVGPQRPGARGRRVVRVNPKVAAIMANQHGLILRRQVLAMGVPPERLTALLRRGEWVHVWRGVYAVRALWDSLDEYRGRPLLRVRAASLNMSMPHVISHDSAALLHGIRLLDEPPRWVHITRFGVHGSRTKNGVKHHKAPYEPGQIVFVDGLPTLDVPRTAVDVCREHGGRAGLVACDSALQLVKDRSLLWAAVAPMRSWRHVTTVRACIEQADPGAESVAETLGRKLATELGLGPVETQFGLRDGGREAWCDLRIGRHLIEIDGHKKYRVVADGGLATSSADEVLWREKRRQDWVCGFKLGMSRVTWADLQPDRWEATKRRVLREALDTNARFGTSIDDLAPYIIRRLR